MAYEAFDARKNIINTIGTDWDIDGDGELEKCIMITDSASDTMYVPMYVREIAETECPPLPYIIVDLLSIPSVPHDVNAATRYKGCLISFDIVFHRADNINVANFGKKVADKIVDLTQTNQCSIAGIDFMNIHNEGRIHIENRCEEIILHWIMELSADFFGTY